MCIRDSTHTHTQLEISSCDVENSRLVFCVTRSNATDVCKILLSLTRLFGFRVKVERSRTPGALPQWHRCQRFGHHHTDACNNAPACVRYTFPNFTKHCDTPPLRSASIVAAMSPLTTGPVRCANRSSSGKNQRDPCHHRGNRPSLSTYY